MKENRSSLVAIGILSVFACVMVLLGAFSVWEGYHTGFTKRGLHVVSQGASARWLGGLQISVGLMLLGIAMPTPKIALRWMLFFIFVAFACLVMALRTK